MATGYPVPIVDDSQRRVARNGTDGPVGLAVTSRLWCVGAPDVRRSTTQPKNGRMICIAAIITSHAIGTAAKKPRAALHALRRRRIPDPLGCGTTR